MSQEIGTRTDRRRHERIRKNHRVTLESLQLGVNNGNRVVNLSDSGLYFETDQLLQPGDDVFIQVENPASDEVDPYQCHHSKIMWGTKLKSAAYAYGYGVKFVQLSQKQNSSDDDADEMIESRRHPRKVIHKRVTFRHRNRSYPGLLTDISRNGCFIQNRELLGVGQFLELSIPGTKFNDRHRLKTEVVRLSPVGVGLKFKHQGRRSQKRR